MRSFDVETAASLSGSYTPVGKTFSPGTRTGYITYSFGAKTSKYWGLNVKSNHGNRAYTSARFVQLLCCTACVVGQNVGPLIKTAKANTHHGKCSPLSTMLRHVHGQSLGLRVRETRGALAKAPRVSRTRSPQRRRLSLGAVRTSLACAPHHSPSCCSLLPQKTTTLEQLALHLIMSPRATERLFWHGGAHTAKPESASRDRFLITIVLIVAVFCDTGSHYGCLLSVVWMCLHGTWTTDFRPEGLGPRTQCTQTQPSIRATVNRYHRYLHGIAIVWRAVDHVFVRGPNHSKPTVCRFHRQKQRNQGAKHRLEVWQ